MLRCILDALARRRNAELDGDLETNPRLDDVSPLRVHVRGNLRVLVMQDVKPCLHVVVLALVVHVGGVQGDRLAGQSVLVGIGWISPSTPHKRRWETMGCGRGSGTADTKNRRPVGHRLSVRHGGLEPSTR